MNLSSYRQNNSKVHKKIRTAIVASFLPNDHCTTRQDQIALFLKYHYPNMNRSVWQKQHCPPDLMYTKWSEATNPPHSMCLKSKPSCSHRTPNRLLHILLPDQAVSATGYWYPVWPQYAIACSSFSVHNNAP